MKYKTVVAEIMLKRKKIFFALSYRHPNMSVDEVEVYMSRLEKTYESIHRENPYVSIICGDFNSRSPVFWEGDSENIINEPTQIRDDGSQTCIDLICTDRPFLFVDSGVLPSLNPHSKHNIIHGTLSSNLPRPLHTNGKYGTTKPRKWIVFGQAF